MGNLTSTNAETMEVIVSESHVSSGALRFIFARVALTMLLVEP